MAAERGAIRLRGVSRSFRVFHERNQTLKETLLRRRRAAYEERWVVREVHLDVAPGQSVGIVGENGSGKSTLLKLLAGIVPPHAGTVEIGGTVASLLELGAGFHPDFTGRENVVMNGTIQGLSERQVAQRFDAIVDFAELGDFIDMPVRTYSSGMAMRLAFSIAAHVEPDVLLLDEVLAVGDEAFQRKCFGRIAEFRRNGGTLVFVSHDPAAVERVCDRALLLADGRVAADGDPVTVLAEYHRLLAGSGGPAPDGSGAGERDGRSWGSGEVRIASCELRGPDGPTDRFSAGDPLTVAIDVEARRRVETPNFGISIHTIDGVLLYATNTRMDALPVADLDGRARVTFTIPRLALHEGRFAVSLAVASHDESVVYHWLDRWLEFSVFQRVTGQGPVDLSGSWALAPVAAPDAGATARQPLGST
ncbi:ABC transporter ATP-binding protein [Miltoncostaea marina]|uniref:ABC transporter ATP-binding protein n=1 Tax=Miltoncostaea marina TaxID=2843215 RepID=UPI001C3DE097|nr:ABC transporter ATP-binding protein [Miltoncostaea marina]